MYDICGTAPYRTDALPEDPSSESVQVELFPYLAGRRAGLSYSRFGGLVCSGTVALLDRCLDLEELGQALAGPLCSALESLAATAPQAHRFQAIGVKRDIFNDRPSRSYAACEGLSALDAGMLDQWRNARRERSEALQEADRVCARETFESRVLLQRLLRKSEFRNGLALASPDLSYEFDAYVNAAEPHRIPRALRSERSLVRYYSRCVFKLSPFSSFTHSFVAYAGGDDMLRRPRIRRDITLSRALTGHLGAAISGYPALTPHVPVRMTRNIIADSKRVYILRQQYPSDGGFRMRVPREALVTVRPSEIIERAAAFIQESGGVVAPDRLKEHLHCARRVIDELLRLGILVQDIPLPQDDSSGLEALVAVLTSTLRAETGHLVPRLTALREAAARFPTGQREPRTPALRALSQTVSGIFGEVGAPTPWKGSIVYENCIEDRIRRQAIPDGWSAALDDLGQFLRRHGSFLDANFAYRDEVRNVLATCYRGGPVRFLEFLDVFPKAAFSSERIRKFQDLSAEFGAALSSSSEEDSVDLRRIDAETGWSRRAAELVEWPEIDSAFSVACHCQPLAGGDGQPALVVDAFQNGSCRSVLRLLSGLADGDRAAALSAIRAAFDRAWAPAEPCEVRATFDFNGNLHPQVTGRVIDYLGDGQAGANGIPLSALSMRLGPNGELLLIDDSTGRRIVPLDLSSMASVFFPYAYSLLAAIGNANVMSHRVFHPYTWAGAGARPGAVARFPRLMFGRCVLRRRGWAIPREQLPQRGAQETDGAYFLRVRRWQRQLGLPDEVFVHEPPLWGNLKETIAPKRVWHGHKPQYLHFGSYLFISLFAKIAPDVAGDLYIEEMLPDRSHWSALKMTRAAQYVTEFWISRRRLGSKEDDGDANER